MLATAALLLLGATALGAYASHGLPPGVDAQAQRTLELAIQYQFFTGLGILGLALAADRYPDSGTLKLAALSLAVGAVLFCGSIYATTFGAPAFIGRLTPLGGIAMLAGWALVGIAAWRLGRTGSAH